MDVKISTQTFLAYTNMNSFNLEKLFDKITLTKELIYANYKRKERGDKDKKKSKPKNFSNCISFSFFFDKKKINLKLFKNGVVQISGCKSRDHCTKGLVFLWDVVKKTPSCHLLNGLNVYLVSVMRNAVFNSGFPIDGEKLEKYFLKYKEHSLVIGMCSKGSRFIKLVDSTSDMPVYVLDISRKDNSVSLKEEIIYEKLRKEKKITKLTTEKNDAITVFSSGRIIFSGVHEKYQDPTIKWFLNTVFKIKDEIMLKEYPTISLKDYLRPKNSEINL